MSAFFNSLKADLLDRRLTPLLALLGVALVAAVVYAVLAGGAGSSGSPVASAPAPTPKTAGIAVSAVSADTTAASAETTSCSAQQTGGSSRNPFAPLPGVKAATSAGSGGESASGPATSGSSGGGAEAGAGSAAGAEPSSGSESGSSPSGGAKAEEEKSSKPAKPRKAYKVSVLFGTAAPGTPLLSAELTSYENLKRQQPLPSAKQPLIVFRGVIAGGKSATFTLVGEAILRGAAACLPNASQCQAIDLKPGDTEELEYVPLGGTAVAYQLHVVSIATAKAKGASAHAGFGGESKAGLRLLRSAGLTALPGLHYSSDGSVLVFSRHGHAFAARAHASAWTAAFKG